MSASGQERLSEPSHEVVLTDYRALISEAQRETEPQAVQIADYDEIAQHIHDSALYYRSRGLGGNEARTALREVYVHDQANDLLAGFANIAIDAPAMSAVQRWLDDHPAGSVTAQERVQARELAYLQCEYNNLVREVILGLRPSLDRPKLSALLDTATGGRATKFLHSVVTGMTAEIALFDSMRSMPGMTDVAFTDVDADFSGTDIIARFEGKTVGFDVKFDKNVSDEGITRVYGIKMPHFTIGVPVETIDDLGASQIGQKALQRRMTTMFAASTSMTRSK